MGACLSCLYPERRDPSSTETQPLLDETSIPQDSDSNEVSTKNQQYLSRIVQSTHDHFIDITTLGQPEFEHQDDVSAELVDRINQVDAVKVWSWPTLRPLTDEENVLLDQWVPDTVRKTTVPDFSSINELNGS